MPKITLINKNVFVGSLVDVEYSGKIEESIMDESIIERIKADVQHIAGDVGNINIWAVKMECEDVLCQRALICWEYYA